jgi:hypothetical protein
VSLGVSAMAGASPARPTKPTKATLESSLRTTLLPVFRVVAGAPFAERRWRNYARKAAAMAMRTWRAP